MSMDAPFVVFGAGENAHKGVICYSSRNTGGWAAKIVQLVGEENMRREFPWRQGGNFL